MNEHSPEQLRAKRDAIDVAVVMFLKNYKAGKLKTNAALFHSIENLNELVVEFKRG